MTSIDFESISNVRDLGGIASGDDRTIRHGLFYRGGALNKATQTDAEKLLSLGITCAIDLRTGWEHREKPSIEIPGIEYIHIPFFDQDMVGIEYIKPLANTRMIGHDFACDPNDFYRAMINPLTVGQMKKALHVVFDRAQAGLSTYVHCSGGKDRAGVLSMLILAILGANRADILEDYLLTNIARDKNFDSIYARFLRLCEDPDRALEITNAHRALPENLDHVYDEIEIQYGSVDAFIHDALGFNDEDISQIRMTCTEKGA